MDDILSESFLYSLNEDIANLSSDLFDNSLELLASDKSPFAKIPIISTAISVCKIGHTVSELYHLNQLYHFISEMNKGIVGNQEKHERFARFLSSDKKTRNKEIEYVVLITSKYLNEDKPKYLARLYISFFEGEIDWDMFVCCSEILDRFLPGDIDTLERGSCELYPDENASASLLRLCGLGLFVPISSDADIPFSFSGNKIEGSSAKKYQLTNFGKKMRDCLGFSDMGYLMKTVEELTQSNNV